MVLNTCVYLFFVNPCRDGLAVANLGACCLCLEVEYSFECSKLVVPGKRRDRKEPSNAGTKPAMRSAKEEKHIK